VRFRHRELRPELRASGRLAAYIAIGGFRVSRGSDPRLLRLTMDGLLDRTCGERPRASRIVRVPRLDIPADYVGTAVYHRSGRKYDWGGPKPSPRLRAFRALDQKKSFAPQSKRLGRGRSDSIYGLVFCSIERISPQAKHRKICNSVNDATFGSMKTSTIDIPQIGHGGAE
jgi:hypothetical protein